jgi:tRNA (cmo5U34)-methyltransferase
MTEVAGVFDAVAEEYDEPRRRLVPCFEEFYGTAVAVAAHGLRDLRGLWGRGGPFRVLDLGAGTGLLSARLAAALPAVHLTLVDAAPAMLAVARRRLTGLGIAHTTRVADLADLAAVAGGPYDAVVSALAIHHLDDAGKRALFGRVRQALVSGGVFVNAEQVAGPTPALDRRYDAVWLAQIRALGATEEEIAGARRRMAYDRPASVADQCAWLAEAGFADVDCSFKHWRFAVYGGVATPP